jgi:Circularly permutated YpsA SLOG family
MNRFRVISGGQTGADIGALRAAKAAGVETGGWMPKLWQTEDGFHPEYAKLYGLSECMGDYPARTRLNISDADAVLWFGNPHSLGGRLTLGTASSSPYSLDTFVVLTESTPQDVADWIVGFVLDPNDEPNPTKKTLMVAGNRESKSPGIGELVERFMSEVFAIFAAES